MSITFPSTFSHLSLSNMSQIPPSPTLSPSFHTTPPYHESSGIDFNVMVIVAAMLCALFCALGLNFMSQCMFWCPQRSLTQPVQWIMSLRLNSGLKKKDMVALPTSTYAKNNSSSSFSASGCVICLQDFLEGDKLRVLPKCNHIFHVVCIDKWLFSHTSCPTCRQKLKFRDTPFSLEQIVTT